MDTPPLKTLPNFWQLLAVWTKIGLLSFGGPTGQIALMHRELVERRKWISDRRFLHALNYCMLLPGPEAQQLAIYTGWLLHRTWGGVLAGCLFVLPGAALMLVVSVGYVQFGKLLWVDSIFYGLKTAVMAIVAAALLRIGSKALKNPIMWAIAGLAFAALFWGKLPFPVIILSAGFIGLCGGWFWPRLFDMTGGHSAKSATTTEHAFLIGDEVQCQSPRPTWRRMLITPLVWGAIWWAPVLASWLMLGPGHLLTRQGVFFSKVALVTFGGAYAVLPYVAQQAVEHYHWVTASQMMDGMGLAETTPGPLILVLQFVGFMGGWQSSANQLPPLLLATLCAVMTCWVTFAPGFLFIFWGAPLVERSRENLRMNTFLSAITAAIVGVVLNLAIWFAGQVIVPAANQIDWIAVALASLWFVLLRWRNWEVVWVVLAGAAAGGAIAYWPA